MARNLRAVATACLTTLALVASATPTALAQDPSFCAILTAAEVGDAVGTEVTPAFGDDRSCSYTATDTNQYTMLAITNGGIRMDLAKESYSSGSDVTVAGQPAWISTAGYSDLLYIDRGDGDTLSFQLLDAPAGTDTEQALLTLGELAFPRLGTLAVPTPTPRVQQDAELAALFPTEIGGAPVTVETMTEGLTMEPDQQAQVEDLLASQGKTLADVSAGFAFGMDPAYLISALRIRGADAAALRDPFMAMSGLDGTPTTAQVGGKEVLVASVGGQTQHVYAHDDVLWLVAAEEPILTEVLQKLP